MTHSHPDFDDILTAAERLDGKAWRTPVLQAPTLDAASSAQVLLKCENYQRTGAFKFRGAYNAVSALSAAERERGVVTHSSGNHGQAIARVGQMLQIKTTIVMPDNAPSIKRQAAESYGATIVTYDPDTEQRERVSAHLADTHGFTLIPPFDYANVIAGQGTAAKELFDEAGPLDALLVPCGGGGLLSGSALSSKALHPDCKVIGVEPEIADDAARSFKTGQLQTVSKPTTIADGTRTESLGEITFPLILQNVDAFVTVSEQAIMEAVRFCFLRLKIVVEPSGALGIAALLCGAVKQHGRIGVIISGGNIDTDTATHIFAATNAT